VNASRERKSILDRYKDTIIALNHERKTIVYIFRTITDSKRLKNFRRYCKQDKGDQSMEDILR